MFKQTKLKQAPKIKQNAPAVRRKRHKLTKRQIHHLLEWGGAILGVVLVVVLIVIGLHYAKKTNNPAGADDHAWLVQVWGQQNDGSRIGIDWSAATGAPVDVGHSNTLGKARLARRSEVENTYAKKESGGRCGDYLWVNDGSLANVCNGKVKRYGASTANSLYGAFLVVNTHTEKLAHEALINADFLPLKDETLPMDPFVSADPIGTGDPADAATGYPPAPASPE